MNRACESTQAPPQDHLGVDAFCDAGIRHPFPPAETLSRTRSATPSHCLVSTVASPRSSSSISIPLRSSLMVFPSMNNRPPAALTLLGLRHDVNILCARRCDISYRESSCIVFCRFVVGRTPRWALLLRPSGRKKNELCHPSHAAGLFCGTGMTARHRAGNAGVKFCVLRTQRCGMGDRRRNRPTHLARCGMVN